jgi:hypothetical protein
MIDVVKSSELGVKIGVERCKKQWSGFGERGAILPAILPATDPTSHRPTR